MAWYGGAILYAALVWWFSTGLILYLNRRSPATFGWSLVGSSLLAILALIGVVQTRFDATPGGAYLAFACGVAIWGWHELSYFMGYASGPRTAPCPIDCSPWRRFWLAIQISLYHELAIIATALLLLGLTWGAPNPVALWTYTVLWAMRWSAKLNLFLGVPNLHEDWLPRHLRFISGYMARKPINLLFPFSVTVPTIVVVLIVQSATAPGVEPFSAVALTLVATLLTLAIIEHWFLVLPLPDRVLWSWSLDADPPADAAVDSPNRHAPPEAVPHAKADG
jgi:putative photosynthetic complex assembly protein 2